MPLANRRPSPSRPAASTFRSAPPPPLRGPVHIIDLPFEMRSLGQVNGARWDPATKSYLFRGEALPPMLQPYASELYSLERMQQDDLNGVQLQPSVPERRVMLRQHQMGCVLAVRAAIKADRTGFLVADDVGLGKTMSTWAAIMSMQDVETVLIVCPLAVVAHWRRTIRWMGDLGKRIVVINYDRLKKLFEVDAAAINKMAARRKKKRRVRSAKGVARYGDPAQFDVVVWDECHKLRNPDSARSKLAKRLGDEADFQLWLSATAGQNPIELQYLAPLIAEATGTRASRMTDWVEWCTSQGIGLSKGAFGKVVWRGNAKEEAERKGADDDLETMRRILFDGPVPMGIRRSPTDIAGWPEVNRILMPISLDAEDRALYEQAWGEFRSQLGLSGRGRDSRNALVARLRFRQKASLLRTSATVDLALNLLEQGLQVGISVGFIETMEVVRDALDKAGYAVSLIGGEQSPGDKERQRLDFQNGRTTAVIYTVEEGISLHQGEYNNAKRANIVHDLRWSGIQMKQIEGRTHRDGKFSQVYWMMGENTVEEGVARIVAERIRSMSRMQGDQGTVEEIERVLAGIAPPVLV